MAEVLAPVALFVYVVIAHLAYKTGHKHGYSKACRTIHAAYPEIGWPPRTKRPPEPPKRTK